MRISQYLDISTFLTIYKSPIVFFSSGDITIPQIPDGVETSSPGISFRREINLIIIMTQFVSNSVCSYFNDFT